MEYPEIEEDARLQMWVRSIEKVYLILSTPLCMSPQVEYPEIEEDARPRHRFMSAYEQRKEAWDKGMPLHNLTLDLH